MGCIAGCHFPLNSSVAIGDFDENILEQVRSRGIGVTEVDASQKAYMRGFWVGAKLNENDNGGDSSSWQAAAPGTLNGLAAALPKSVK